jgi:uncharacterized protein (TIGR04141 family)
MQTAKQKHDDYCGFALFTYKGVILMVKKEKNRLKIYLSKHSNESLLEDFQLLKYDEDDDLYPDKISLSDNSILYYRNNQGYSPKWYKNYLRQNDNLLKIGHASGLVFKQVEYGDRQFKFAITFGGGEGFLKTENFFSRFGMKIALNLADKIYSIKKNTVSDAMTNVKEDANKGLEFDSFTFDIEKDLLNGVVVVPKTNSFATGNIVGRDFQSFTTEYEFDNLDQLLIECLKVYEMDDYLEDYGFIDNIEEVSPKNPIIHKIYEEVLAAYIQKDEGRVWFSPAETDYMDRIIEYLFYIGQHNESKRLNAFRDELNTEKVYEFISKNNMTIKSLSDFKKIKIEVMYDDGSYGDGWNLFECLYASIEYQGDQYVVNGGKLYKVKKTYYEGFEEEYTKIRVFPSVLNIDKMQSEGSYNEAVCLSNSERFTLLDKKLVAHNNRKIEVCDFFDNEEKAFIHVNKYGTSALLSHLFAQATVSAELFKDLDFKPQIIRKMNEQNPQKNYEILQYNETKVIIAVITNREIPANGHVKLPFFSKVNAVSTLRYIKDRLGFNEVGMMFIETIN